MVHVILNVRAADTPQSPKAMKGCDRLQTPVGEGGGHGADLKQRPSSKYTGVPTCKEGSCSKVDAHGGYRNNVTLVRIGGYTQVPLVKERPRGATGAPWGYATGVPLPHSGKCT